MKYEISVYWDKRANAHDQNIRSVIYSRREMAAWQKSFSCALGEGRQRILDMGTGPGIVANLLADMGLWSTHAKRPKADAEMLVDMVAGIK